ncbi:ABC transporter permease [Paludibaculum fermentans]|uniref:ABC transporter permease n=1 Tax=Paludibaculum fermentans TaxID=1473598 RepID=A0A7S7NVZ5_PALFE|nr:ABC transporter permease [Paludibaculum fermentans]QOY90815.1 ABC transporter permease [Paludibaculum fermentans]
MKKILNWFRRGDLETGLDRELRYHFERRVNDLIQSGVAEAEAKRQATLEMGGLAQVREEVRDVWLSRWLRDFLYDLRFSARSFLRNPSFTATTMLSLALGIGATTAIYSLVDQVMLHALPVRQPEQLVLVDWRGEQLANGFGSYNLMSYPICGDLQGQTQIFDGVLCRAATTVNLSTGSEPKPAGAEIVSGSYFAVLGVGAAMGRVLGPEDDQTAEASPVVVLSYDFWKTQMDGAADVLGRKVLVNQYPMTVVGVAAPQFRGVDVGEVPSLWIPASMSSQALPGFKGLKNRRMRWMQILGRLKPGMTLERARSGLEPWFQAMRLEDMGRPGFPRITAERRKQYLSSWLEVTPAPQGHAPLRRRLAQPLWVLLAATGVLLGLACLNVAGLFLARGSAREREISTRLALGASRSRIGRQLLADSVLLALAGGLLGLAIAPSAMKTLIAFLPSQVTNNDLHAAVDKRLLFFAFLVSLAAGLLSGFAPALQAGRKSLMTSLRERGGSASGGVRLRKVIVTVQIAFSLILVVGAMLFMRTLTGLLEKGPGFDTTSLVSFQLDPRRNGYTPQQSSQLIRRLHEEIRTAPGTQASAVARYALLTGGSWNDLMTIQGNERISTDRDVNLNAVTPGFFSTMGVRLIAGRDFDERDTRPVGEFGQRTAIVSESFVKRYLGGRSPLGMRVCECTGPDAKPDLEVIGVVADFSYRGIRDNAEQAFFAMLEGNDSGGTFYVKVRGTPEQASASLRSIVRNADPALPISSFRTLDEQVNRSLNTERMLATLSGAFGTLALLLSLVGLYGVMSFVVTQRTREIGIRLALGATGGSAIWLVLRDALVMVGAGMAIALPCVAGLGRLVESQLFGVKATDPWTIGLSALLLATAALGAAMVPAYRASTVNPVEALRLE